MSNKYYFAIDRGGTFTDVLCMCPDGKVRTLKLLSEDPEKYADAPREGIRRILAEVNINIKNNFYKQVFVLYHKLLQETKNASTSDGLVETSEIGWIRMGTTVATNALLERKGDDVALVVNRGFKDLLYIGNQARPKIFEIDIKKPSNLYKTVVEVDCRIVPSQNEICELSR